MAIKIKRIEVNIMFKIIATISFILLSAQFALSQQWIFGKWQGKGRESSNGETWSMRLQAKKGSFKINYPSLKCRGNWKLINYKGNTARFRENINVNKKVCEPMGNVTLKRLDKNRLLFIYKYLGTSKVSSSAILYRIK